MRRPVGAAALVGIVVAAWGMVAIPARATNGTLTTADEPQYLLTALSLFEDRNLNIDDELAEARFAPFHELDLPVQTEVLDDGRQVSPHDPLLPAILAVPMGLGGWAAAKATLAILAGALAALLTWTAHRRFAVPLGVAAGTVLAFGVTAPLSAYATQVYPELPAAVAVTVAIAALTGRRHGTLLVFGVAVVALPWLGVKYAPVAAALVAVAVGMLVRERRARAAVTLAASLALAGAAYLVAHRLLYGGWTVYAAGDHFTGGELTVMGGDPDYAGRSQRLAGLLLDRGFGLAAWMPGYLLAVPALAAFVRRRPAGWWALVVPLAAGWATATWAALTMHGWWWPGRQVVVVVPCLVLAVAWWAGRLRVVRAAVAAAAAFGALAWGWLVVEVLARRSTLVVDFETTTNPAYRAWRALLPDYRNPDTGDWLVQAVWLVVLGALAAGALVGPLAVRP
ncbi:MAG TPA: hypothetical protein VE575_13735, partial [Acidimicrobiales bacterium]|nr:hypothetical protein [Acidimicrobiales bacterium]